MVLISKPFEVKATVDGMSLRFPIRVCRGLQPQEHWHALKKEICWARLTGFSKNEIFRRFPDERRGKAGTWTRQIGLCRSGIQHDTSYCVRRFHVRLITDLLRQNIIPPDSLVNSVTDLKLHISDIRLEVSLFLVKLFPIQWGISVFWSLQFKENI